MATDQEIRDSIRNFLKENLAEAFTSGSINDQSPLISSRLVDSIVALKLVTFLEESFSIEFEAHEVDQENLDSIEIIARFVQSKMK
jgi:acyl carrier protein